MVKSEGTEKKILVAARKIFVEKGLAGARMQEIADEAGINKALLHYYFRSKEKLFDKIFEEVFQSISIGLGDVLNSDLSVFEKIRRVINLYVGVLLENPYMPIFVLNEMSQNPERMQKVLEKGVFPSMMNFFTQLMQEMNTGNVRPIHPVHLILNLIGMIVFPFAVRPMIAPVIKDKMGGDYQDILDERKEVIFEFMCNALKINDHEK